jgi:hypothetical protein
MRILLAATLLVAGPAIAEELVDVPARCRGDLCIVDSSFFSAMIEAHNKQIDEIRALEAKIEAARPKCAELTVTEPSKQKPPPIKVESNS